MSKCPQEAKSLRRLSNMFPFTQIPMDETDRMSNAIHVYCEAGATKIEKLQEQVDMLEECIRRLEGRSNNN